MSKSNAAKSIFNAIASIADNISADATVKHNKKMMESVTNLREYGVKLHHDSARKITSIVEDTNDWLNEPNAPEDRRKVFLEEYNVMQNLIAPYIPTPKSSEPKA